MHFIHENLIFDHDINKTSIGPNYSNSRTRVSRYQISNIKYICYIKKNQKNAVYGKFICVLDLSFLQVAQSTYGSSAGEV